MIKFSSPFFIIITETTKINKIKVTFFLNNIIKMYVPFISEESWFQF
jgi:hypothetical protein